MLFKVSKLKPLLKEAWKSTGLVVGTSEKKDGTADQLYFAGQNWIMSVNYEEISKELKGALIELVGDLPEAGHEIISYKGSNQE